MARTRRTAQPEELEYIRDLEAASSIVNIVYENHMFMCPKKQPDEFTCLAFIGEGTYAKVYKATHEMLGTVAIKRFEKDKYVTPRMKDLLLCEKKITMALKNPFVVKAHATFRDTNGVNLVMDYATHGDFRDFMLELRSNENAARPYFAQLVMGLEYIHAANVIHGDLKPGNIMVFAGGRLKIGDFGFAKKAGPNLIHVMGTPRFMAPEVYHHRAYTDGVDWWALGVIFWMAIFNDHPYVTASMDRNRVMELLRAPVVLPQGVNCTPEFRRMIEGLLRYDPETRLGTLASGVKTIKEHDWFRDFDFPALMNPNYVVEGFNYPEWEPFDEDEEVREDFFKDMTIDIRTDFEDY